MHKMITKLLTNIVQWLKIYLRAFLRLSSVLYVSDYMQKKCLYVYIRFTVHLALWDVENHDKAPTSPQNNNISKLSVLKSNKPARPDLTTLHMTWSQGSGKGQMLSGHGRFPTASGIHGPMHQSSCSIQDMKSYYKFPA